MSGKNVSSRRGSGKRGRRGRRGLRVAIVLLEAIMIVVLSVGCYAVSVLNLVQRQDINRDDIYVYGDEIDVDIKAVTNSPDETQKPKETEESQEEQTKQWIITTEIIEDETEYDFMAHQALTDGYWNILLLAGDENSQETMSGEKGRADVVIICSINAQTKHIKLASIYRDTMVRMYSQDKYIKVNDGIFDAFGGSINEMISIINLNFDMNIQDVIYVSWAALAMAVNVLDGIYLDISQEEIDRHIITGYLTEVVETTGIGTEGGQFVQGGLQKCDGPKVLAYCRNRTTTGSDYARTERQREVLGKLLEKAKTVDFATLLRLVNVVAGNIYTTLTLQEMFSLAASVKEYTLGETMGLPANSKTQHTMGRLSSEMNINDPIVAVDLPATVKELHTFLFGADGFQPSEQVRMIGSNILTLAGLQ